MVIKKYYMRFFSLFSIRCYLYGSLATPDVQSSTPSPPPYTDTVLLVSQVSLHIDTRQELTEYKVSTREYSDENVSTH